MVICLERGADLHMAQLMPLPLTVSCFSKIQIGFTFLVPANLGSLGKRAGKRVCVCISSQHMDESRQTCADERTDGQTGEQSTDRDRQADGRIDRQTDRQTGVQTYAGHGLRVKAGSRRTLTVVAAD